MSTRTMMALSVLGLVFLLASCDSSSNRRIDAKAIQPDASIIKLVNANKTAFEDCRKLVTVPDDMTYQYMTSGWKKDRDSLVDCALRHRVSRKIINLVLDHYGLPRV